MAGKQFVSIVIPTTGDVKYIKGLVESVAKLDYPKESFELILLGDQKTDLLEKNAREARDIPAINNRPPFSVLAITLNPSFSLPNIASSDTITSSNEIEPVDDWLHKSLPAISW